MLGINIDSKDVPTLVNEFEPDEYGDPFENLYQQIIEGSSC